MVLLNLLGVALVEDLNVRLFAFADLGSERFCLVVGHPEGRGVAAHVSDHPEPEHVHTAVRNPAGPQGSGDRDTAPRLDPRLRARFQTGDDFLADPGGGRQAAASPLATAPGRSPARGIWTSADRSRSEEHTPEPPSLTRPTNALLSPPNNTPPLP